MWLWLQAHAAQAPWWVWPAFVAVALLVAWWGRGRRRFFLGGGIGWGTVYVFQDMGKPGVVKVGTTRRLSKTRKSEVSRTMASGGELRQVFAVDMPFARAVEREAHRRLRRRQVRWWWWSKRGREWFKAKGDRGLESLFGEVERAALDVRAYARRRGRWPKDMDDRAKIWRLQDGRAVTRPLFEA